MASRGVYTAATGMLVQQYRMDVISNNLANATTTGYKRDESIDKAFPDMLLRRMEKHTVNFPFNNVPTTGSIDKAPVVGKVGTGVEQNEIFTVFEQGPLRTTDNPLDAAISGDGFFVVDTPNGERFTRNGNFIIGNGNILMTKEGYPVLGEKGYIRVQDNNVRIDNEGRIMVNANLRDPVSNFVDARENDWTGEVELDRFKISTFDFPRYLQKQGDSLWVDTQYSGAPMALSVDNAQRPVFHQGVLEASNVNPVREMVQMIEVQRAYEASKKAVDSQDGDTEKLLSMSM